MKQFYIFAGIDGSVQMSQAMRSSSTDYDQTIVHLHGKPRKCGDFKHVMFENGKQVDTWGKIDGSALSAQGE